MRLIQEDIASMAPLPPTKKDHAALAKREDPKFIVCARRRLQRLLVILIKRLTIRPRPSVIVIRIHLKRCGDGQLLTMDQLPQGLIHQLNLKFRVPVINHQRVIAFITSSHHHVMFKGWIGFVYKDVQSLGHCGHCFSKPLLEYG